MKKAFLLLLVFICFKATAQSPKILVPYRVGDKWGYSDTLGNISIQPKYDRADLFYYGESIKPSRVAATVVIKDEILAIDESGTALVPGGYESIETIYINKGIQFIVQNAKEKKGLFANGKELIPLVYDEVTSHANDSYLVQKGKKVGLINSRGETVIPVEYDEVEYAYETPNGMQKWIATKNKISKTFLDKQNGPLSDEFLPPRVMQEEKLYEGDINDLGETLREKYALDSVLLHGNVGLIYKDNKMGVKIFDMKDNSHFFFSEKYTIGEVLYLGEGSFDREKYKAKALLIAINKEGKHGLITEKEKQILPFEYDAIDENGSYLILTKGGKKGFVILYTPYPFIKANYDAFIDYYSIPVKDDWSFGLFEIEKNGKAGYVGENGVEFFKDK
jgi:hypothetical protein